MDRSETKSRRTSPMRYAVVTVALSAIVGAMPFPATAQGTNIELVAQVGGTPHAIEMIENLVYLGEGPNLSIFDISQPRQSRSPGQGSPFRPLG